MILLVYLLSSEKNKFTNKYYPMVLWTKSVYYEGFLKKHTELKKH